MSFNLKYLFYRIDRVRSRFKASFIQIMINVLYGAFCKSILLDLVVTETNDVWLWPGTLLLNYVHFNPGMEK